MQEHLVSTILENTPDATLGQRVVAIAPDAFRDIVFSIFRRCGFESPKIDNPTMSAFGVKTLPIAPPLSGNRRTELSLSWHPIPGESQQTHVRWQAIDQSPGWRGRHDGRTTDQFGREVDNAVDEEIRRQRIGQEIRPVQDPLLGPGERLDRLFSGNLRDYSHCATQQVIADLTTGVLPLGRYRFERSENDRIEGPNLYLSRYRTSARMEYNGTMICAPQNSGKTSLIVRWAQAANQAGYNVFLVDVKGNLWRKLEGRLQGNIYYFSTDPRETHSDRINFLAGLSGRSAIGTERIQALAEALVPDFGKHQDADNRRHQRNNIVWLTSLIHILKLRDDLQPHFFKNDDGTDRSPDLNDLYELLVDEKLLHKRVAELRALEEWWKRNGPLLPHPVGVEHWLREAAHLFDPKIIADGQRRVEHSFRDYTQTLVAALEPFSKHGTLYPKIRDQGRGRLFSLEDLGRTDEQVTILISARAQDLEKSRTVLTLAIKRLQHLLFDRFDRNDEELRPVLLLLDETRRIRSFDPNEYITFAREAKAGCVIVYQSLDQIGEDAKIREILENVGTQIYLGSLVGATASYFIDILPDRYRARMTEQIGHTQEGQSRTQTVDKELVKCLTTNELYRLPAGDWPALVYINDQPRRAPILTDMSEGKD